MDWAALHVTGAGCNRACPTIPKHASTIEVAMAKAIRASVVRPYLPLVVIHHSRPILGSPLSTPMEQQWETLQRQLASHYRHHIFILAEHSGHNIPREQPALIIEAIHGLL